MRIFRIRAAGELHDFPASGLQLYHNPIAVWSLLALTKIGGLGHGDAGQALHLRN